MAKPIITDRREHRFAVDNLSAYIDGELSARACDRIKEHLRQCPSCREDAQTLRQTALLLGHAPRQPAPRSFALPASAAAEQQRYRRWGLAQTWLRTASAIVSIVLILLVSGDAMISNGWLSPSFGAQAPEAIALMAPEPARSEAVTGAETTRADEIAPDQVGAQALMATEAVATSEIRPMMAEAAPETEAAPATLVVAQKAPPPAQPAIERGDALAPATESGPGPQRQILPSEELQATGDRSMTLPRASSAPAAGVGGGGPAHEEAPAAQALAGEEPAAETPEIAKQSARELTAPVEAEAENVGQEPPLERVTAPPAEAPLQEPAKSEPATPEASAHDAVLMSEASPQAEVAIEEPMTRAEAPVSVPAVNTSLVRLWRSLRVASGVALGLLLMLVAGLLVVRQRKRI